ncbi:peptidase S24/S26A/S26B/S26C [Nitzschia inconspicua]|uniref:Mitochondrial inner membrane protease subunit n=1 Tax=Nitzschia inconspicua TaxID=303405 RepID=A0A9K3PQK6_9STRA|nr:peptidase S24/S26A/S26B/S26C [Nitzschia inconspicua]
MYQRRGNHTLHHISVYRGLPSRRFTSNVSNRNVEPKSNDGIPKNKLKPSGRSSEPPPSWTAAVQEVVPLVGVFAWRLCLAYGFVYVFWEYGVEITICEGPSMIPTLKGDGDEVVLLDRWSPLRLGLQGGPSGSQRATDTRQRQREFLQQQQQQQQTPSLSHLYPNLWHEPKIPANTFPVRGMWERFWRQWTTPISVGDVVVLQHPHRAGTVCKRVVGLPGDTVFTPRSQAGAWQFYYQQGMEAYLENGGLQSTLTKDTSKESHRAPAQTTMIPYQTNLPKVKRQQRSTTVVVPDGHLWVEGDNPWNSNDSRNYGPIPASLIVGRVLCRIWPVTGSNARMERGDRPIHNDRSKPTWSFSGSIVFPAGYRDEIIVRNYQQWQQILSLQQQNQQQQRQQSKLIARTNTIPRRDVNLNTEVAAAEPKEPKTE